MSDLLQNLLTEPHDALEADSDFGNPAGDRMVDFIIQDKGDIATQLEASLKRGTGVACILELITATCDAPDAYPVSLAPLMIVAELSENVVLNRKPTETQGVDYLTLRQALGMVMDKLHHFQYSSGNILALPGSKPAFKIVEPSPGAAAAFQIYFETTEVLSNTRDAAFVISGTGTIADAYMYDSGVATEFIQGTAFTDTGDYNDLDPTSVCNVVLAYSTYISKWILTLADESEAWTNDAAYGDGTVPTAGWSVGGLLASPAPTIVLNS